MTLRRDIEYLEERGELIKVRGGARSMKFLKTAMEDEFGKRLSENTEEKTSIAKTACTFPAEGTSVFLDAGTTAMKFASELSDMRMTVTTTGPLVAIELSKKSRIIVNLVGGMLNNDNLSVSGMNSIKFLEDINIDTAFMVPSGCTVQDGMTCGNYSDFELKKYIIKKARRVIMMMDSSKVGRSLPYTFCNFSDIDILITDSAPSDELAAKLAESSVKTVIAGETPDNI